MDSGFSTVLVLFFVVYHFATVVTIFRTHYLPNPLVTSLEHQLLAYSISKGYPKVFQGSQGSDPSYNDFGDNDSGHFSSRFFLSLLVFHVCPRLVRSCAAIFCNHNIAAFPCMLFGVSVFECLITGGFLCLNLLA